MPTSQNFLSTMSMFNSAQNFVLTGGEFISNIYSSNLNGIDILYKASLPDAAVDAEERSYAPRCFPGTREQYIHDIVHWATAAHNETTLPLYWMRGPAGVGKSAIAQTCAEKVKEAGQLGAAFFFSINGRSDHRRLVPSLAYQLSTVFPDYHTLLNEKINNDQSLVSKRLASQFISLIVEPLERLEREGRGVGRGAIFIDGLDECQSNEAQVEIIELIGSAGAWRTPFRWAIFSRSEPHIQATFAEENISSICRCVLLPISSQAERDIEIYLRNGFKNILRRRNLLSTWKQWPSEANIRDLVIASAGLFAYPAAVLRFVDQYSFSSFEETLQLILEGIGEPNCQQNRSATPFAELDTLYSLILERIPRDMLPSIQLFLGFFLVYRGTPLSLSLDVARVCNALGFTENKLRLICHQLHAVLQYDDFSDVSKLRGLSSSRQQPSFALPPQYSFPHFYGVIRFHHKSFCDFLLDPERSSKFCIKSPAALERLFNCLVKRHHSLAQSIVLQSLDVATSNRQNLLPSLTGDAIPITKSSMASLSWPIGNEIMDNFLLAIALDCLSFCLTHDGPMFEELLKKLPLECLQQLSALDYRKDLVVDTTRRGVGLYERAVVYAQAGVDRLIPGTIFSCLSGLDFHHFDSSAFVQMVKKLESLGVIVPCHVDSSWIRCEREGTQRGLYTLGHGEKGVYWYWEFDETILYFHEFRTVNFVQAMKLYQSEKFNMWAAWWELPPLDFIEGGIPYGS